MNVNFFYALFLQIVGIEVLGGCKGKIKFYFFSHNDKLIFFFDYVFVIFQLQKKRTRSTFCSSKDSLA